MGTTECLARKTYSRICGSLAVNLEMAETCLVYLLNFVDENVVLS